MHKCEFIQWLAQNYGEELVIALRLVNKCEKWEKEVKDKGKIKVISATKGAR